jgi:hypothetical protein
MIVGRLLGWVFLILGYVVLGRDVIGWVDTHRFEPIVLGQLWYDLDRGSLNLAQAIIQRYIAPALWDPVITTVLLCWAWPVFAGIGLILIVLMRHRGDRPLRRRRR